MKDTKFDRTLNGTQRMLDDMRIRRGNWADKLPAEPNPTSRVALRRKVHPRWRKLRRQGTYVSLGSLLEKKAA